MTLPCYQLDASGVGILGEIKDPYHTRGCLPAEETADGRLDSEHAHDLRLFGRKFTHDWDGMLSRRMKYACANPPTIYYSQGEKWSPERTQVEIRSHV